MSNIPTIGIDLGTTFSCVAVIQNNQVKIIKNHEDTLTLPSYVAFNETRCFVGQTAKNQASMNCENTIFDVKRIIGRNFNDKIIELNKNHWPFKIIDSNGKPKIQVTSRKELKEFYPEQISGMILMNLKKSAENILGCKITNAVITVPAYFNDEQRQATKQAGKIAGFKDIRIINEPTAAALAYNLDKKINKTNQERHVLIFDLGGGTFDVSIVKIKDKHFSVIAVGGNNRLGGEDFDTRMVEHFIEEIKRKHSIDISTNKRQLRQLRTSCESAKKYLSSVTIADIEIAGLFGDTDFFSTISRASFDEMNIDLFQSTIDTVKKVISDGKINKTDINDVVLIGGSTRILKIQKLLEDLFDGKQLIMSINGDEAVAYGAAVMGAILDQNLDCDFKDLVIVDVTPLSLGIRIKGGIMDTIIKRNTPIPIKKTKDYVTSVDFQKSVSINIFEGERSMTADNYCLESFNVDGITPELRGKEKIDVTFQIDVNGILKATAVDRNTQNKNEIILHDNRGRFSQKEIEQMISDAIKFHNDDEKNYLAAVARNELENLSRDVKYSFENRQTTIPAHIKDLILGQCEKNIIICCNDLDKKDFYINRKTDLEELLKVYKVQTGRNK